MLTSLFSLFYITGEFHRFLHRGRASITFSIASDTGSDKGPELPMHVIQP